MTAALIFDLDDTLVDSAALSVHRDAKAWKKCAAQFHETAAFGQVASVVSALRLSGVKVGIVTASVSYYASGLLRHHRIEYDHLVAYHDTRLHKPHPDPVLLCLERLGASQGHTVAVGDSVIDATAYKGAGIPALGAGWSPRLDKAGAWDAIISTPEELLSYFA